MYIISLTEGNHSWSKQNLVTIMTKHGNYDVLKCTLCGIEGRTHGLSAIGLKGSFSKEKVYSCPGYVPPPIPEGSKFFVTDSPWPERLPNGTEIVRVESKPRADGNWFKRADGKLLFENMPGEEHGMFKLFDREFKTEIDGNSKS